MELFSLAVLSLLLLFRTCNCGTREPKAAALDPAILQGRAGERRIKSRLSEARLVSPDLLPLVGSQVDNTNRDIEEPTTTKTADTLLFARLLLLRNDARRV